MNRLRTFWTQRTARERTLLILLTSVLMALILWLHVWQPLRQAQEQEVQRQTRLNVLARQMASLPTRASAASAESVLRQRAAAQGIALASVTRSANQFQVTVEKANGDALLAWLLTLEAQGAAQVLELNVRGNTPPDGTVSATALLEAR